MKCCPMKSQAMEIMVSSRIIFHILESHSGSNFDPVRDANTLIDAIELLTTSVEVQTVEDSESVENINIHNIDGDTTENVLLMRVQ